MRRMSGYVVIALLGVGACSKASIVGSGIDHPMKANEVIVRIDQGGGFIGPTYAPTHLPVVSLMGDGSVITGGPQIELYPPPALPSIIVRTITEDGIQSILVAARDAGLFGADRTLTDDRVADAGTTVFTAVENGKRHTISAYALDEAPESTSERDALRRFRDDMSDLARWLPPGSVGDDRQYEATRMRIVVEAFDPASVDEGLTQVPKDWPLSGALATFGEANEAGYRCGAVGGEDLRRVLDAARTANTLTPWVSDAKKYRLSFRPLMADESDC